MEILVDFAINNAIMCNGMIVDTDLADLLILYKDSLMKIFIVMNPGSYTGIRKSLTLSIVKQYTQSISMYYCDILEYFRTYSPSVGCIVGKHIWTLENNIMHVYSLNNPPTHKIEVCNQQMPFAQYNYKIIDINMNTLWNNRHSIFKQSNDIIYPKYCDQFTTI